MSSLSWKINRIKAMGYEEVVFRISRAVKQKLEKRRLIKGWQPLPSTPVKNAEPLFASGLSSIQKSWISAFGSFDENAYEVALNKINLFTHFDVDITNPVDWHQDPDTGVRSPLIYGKDIDYRDNSQVGNCKTLWELSRHKHLVPLAVAYVMTGKVSYADKIIEHIDGWVEQNPFGFGVHWCSSLEVSLRLIAWSFVHHIMCLRHPGGLLDKLEHPEKFSLSIYQHVYFIVNYLSRFSSANNHLIGELTGVWVACNLFDLGDDGVAWSSFAKKELELEAEKQVFDDGVSREQATYYHLWVNEYFLLVWLIGAKCADPMSEEFASRIAKMTQFLHDLRPSGGQVPQIGDSDDGLVLGFDPENKFNPYDDLFQSYSKLTKDYQLIQIDSVSKAFWYGTLHDCKLDEMPLMPPLIENQESIKVYRQGGYAIIKDAGFHAIFDAGPLGYPSIAAHGHADALSICIAWDGDWWIIDPGTYCYHTDPFWRDYFRGTGAHNTLLINNTNQSQIGGAFLWLKRADIDMESYGFGENIYVEGSVVGYSSKKIKHSRSVNYNKAEKEFVVVDLVDSNEESEFEVRYHFHPDVMIEKINNRSLTAVRKNSKRSVVFSLDENLEWSIHSGESDPPIGWYSETLGVKSPCKVLVGEGSTRRQASCSTKISWSDNP